MIIRKKRKQKEQEEKSSKKTPQKETQKRIEQSYSPDEDILDSIDINAIVEQRSERRRGDRRRGYRRVDDRNLISRAEEEAKKIKEAAAKDGFSQGLKSCHVEVAKLKEAVEGLLNAKETCYTSITDDLVELSVKIAEKLIKKELSVNKSVVLSIIADVLKELGKDEKQLTVRVNPEDESNVRLNIPNMFPSSQTEAKILIEADATIEEGSCIVETKSGVIDARFSTQIAILQNAFKEQL